MVSQDKLIKNALIYNDKLFEEIKHRLSQGVKYSDTLEEFLERTKDYTTNNPLVTSGFQNEMLNIVLQATNNTKFSRASQRELTRIIIENHVGELITNVGEDIKNDVRDIVKKGFDEGLHPQEISKQIENGIDTINKTRARTLARTEVKRADTISNYIVANEQGATHFEVYCRPDCCPICKKDYLNKEYTVHQTDMLPPRHPNCRCGVRLFKK